ncbi:MAG: DUF4174 domain-containing protein [Proteobacteria bacterium]|jgi:hypothetical protein|nr:DUF4174 domain-containing protein [Pseudomonadota bacterium]
MKFILILAMALFNPVLASADEINRKLINQLQLFGSEKLNLQDLILIKRVVLVFADSPQDPNFIRQIKLLNERPDALINRDVVVLIDTDPLKKSDIRKQLRPRGFMLVLIGKDGTIALRKSSPWNVREISRSIDKMPLRKQEIKINLKLINQ